MGLQDPKLGVGGAGRLELKLGIVGAEWQDLEPGIGMVGQLELKLGIVGTGKQELELCIKGEVWL